MAQAETDDSMGYAVMTMCHCDEHSYDGEPTCDGHWMVGIPKSGYDEETGHVSVASEITDGFHTREDAQLFAEERRAAAGRR